ncbi:MAG: BlaI/MecI/CopY family transcriptional regulator [Maricaulis sp.]|jgi:predicted transcriptional regulator|nr:BlaI/MecI/CopY family transcriptional regulator [Maricaulis sp.]MDG2043793.1 BlaI/MecI/CopY family transcriptional regulator [Maricaulis sp.]
MPDQTPSQAELVVLKHLWAGGTQSAREVHNRAGEEMGWSYSTTRTLLTRMSEKGLVLREDTHGLSIYSAQVEKVAMMGRLIRTFADTVLEMDGPLPATAFANSKLFSEEEAEALGRLLEGGDCVGPNDQKVRGEQVK